ncbi:MAG: hypothetical protein IJD04_00500 [Desulfovibrionaceae bacterium]|nr:hypothetical protein [Desulfovibrionaceae bacterium]
MTDLQPTRFEIVRQLELILNSPDFLGSGRLRSFLSYVVEETLAGRGHLIKAYRVAVDVFELGEDFDSSLNPSIRVAAGRLRNKLEHYYFTSSNDDRVKITLPKGSYIPRFSYLPDTRNKVAPAAEAGAVGGTKLSAPLVVESMFRSEGAASRNVSAQSRMESRPTVLIAPFKSIGGHQALGEFLLGLSEEIGIALTRFDELSVVLTSVLPGIGDEPDIWKAARSINARFIVGGSAQIGGAGLSDLRLRVYLLDSSNQSQVWAERYEGCLSNESLFEIQDAITQQVAARIGDSFGLINRMLLMERAGKSPAELEVYEAMLYYHHWVVSLTPERFVAAKNALEQAIELDPHYATTKAMLSDVYASHCQWGMHIFEGAQERSLILADQALELDGNCQYAHWAKAYNCYLRREENQFLDSVYRAIKLNDSNTNIVATAGKKLAMIGKTEEGLNMLSRALRLNPHIPSWYRSAPFVVHFIHQEYEQALMEARHITTPQFMWGPLMRAAAHGMLGQKEEGRAEIEKLMEIEPDFHKIGEKAMLLLFFQPKSVEKIMAGLYKAGL